jgi:hypothetical protein
MYYQYQKVRTTQPLNTSPYCAARITYNIPPRPFVFLFWLVHCTASHTTRSYMSSSCSSSLTYMAHLFKPCTPVRSHGTCITGPHGRRRWWPQVQKKTSHPQLSNLSTYARRRTRLLYNLIFLTSQVKPGQATHTGRTSVGLCDLTATKTRTGPNRDKCSEKGPGRSWFHVERAPAGSTQAPAPLFALTFLPPPHLRCHMSTCTVCRGRVLHPPLDQGKERWQS